MKTQIYEPPKSFPFPMAIPPVSSLALTLPVSDRFLPPTSHTTSVVTFYLFISVLSLATSCYAIPPHLLPWLVPPELNPIRAEIIICLIFCYLLRAWNSVK